MSEKVTEVLSSGQIASGKYVQLFEREFSKLIDVDYSVSINDMTNAIYLALKLSGVKEGDEVLAV
ncbi:MAG: DegT/DnrJ/EryC1/StrS family aminotransferase, partial [Shewanella sp.]